MTTHLQPGPNPLRPSRALPLLSDSIPVELKAVGAGLALGGAAIFVDSLDVNSQIARLVFLAASTGLSWGAAAVVLGRMSATWLRGVAAGTVCLLAAVVAYYGGIAAVGTRPNSSAAILLDAAIVWLFAGAAGGVALGATGWFSNHGRPTTKALAWGCLGGALSSQGTHLLYAYFGPGAVRSDGLWLPTFAISATIIPILAAAFGARRHRPWLAFVTSILTADIGGIAWSLVLTYLR